MKPGLVWLVILALMFIAMDAPAESHDGTFSKEDAGEQFVRAMNAYRDGKYRQAEENFEALIGHGFESGPLYYNLGNSKLRAGKLGEAIASYLRAERFLPRDGDLAANLKFARESAKDDLATFEPSVLETIFFWHRGLSMAELAASVLLLNGIFWLVWLVRIYLRKSEWLRWMHRTLLLALIGLGSSFGMRMLSPVERAVVLPVEVTVHASTQEKSTVLFKLHEGAEVQVVDRASDWIRISLPDQKQGWVAARHVMVVSL